MSDLQERLQTALGSSYHVERELGGGGMSRVFLAEEVALRRHVVVKVLPPEMSAGVNDERFRREIQLAASLQHPHIVPVLTAGSADDLLYYVMPFIEGESLRAKLARQRELPVSETIHILRDVLDALAAAHEHGVVHRDIKPDNVLLSGRHALVTDFGVAKAVSEAAKGSALTSFGIALGTPAYMAPEQAAADPNVDHRADLYAVGALAYEMLCGRPPFQMPTPQQVLIAHVTQAPEPCTLYRPTVPEALNALVMRCLEKKAADRPQSAEELLGALTAMSTPSGGMPPTGATAVSSGTRDAIARNHPLRVAILSLVAGLAVLGAAYGLARLIGVPSWVVPSVAAVLAIGVLVLYLTGRQERRRLIDKSTGAIRPSEAEGLWRHLTWKRSLVTGGLTLVLLALLTGAWMAMRVLGIGPLGTLMAKGLLHARDTVLIADFENRTTDSSLGHTITELVRLDLEQSRAVTLFQPDQVREALGRMRKPANTALTPDVARELAQRENLKALLTGEIVPVGTEFVVSARLVAAGSGAVLTTRRETAASLQDLLGAVDRLSAGLRERVGESLRSIQAELPIGTATTSSFEALQAYVQGSRANAVGDTRRALTLLRQAVAIDSTFAEAYRKRGIIFANYGFPRDSIVRAMTKAYAFRRRLPDAERLLIEGGYHSYVTEDADSTIAAYRGVLDRRPDDAIALQNLAYAYKTSRRFVEAESLYAVLCATVARWGCTQVAAAYQCLGKFDEAGRALDRAQATWPGAPSLPYYRAQLALARGHYDEAERIVAAAVAGWRAVGIVGIAAAEYAQMQASRLRGHQREVERHRLAWGRARRTLNPRLWPEPLDVAYWALGDAIWFGKDTRGSRTALAGALERTPLTDRAPVDRGYANLAAVFAQAGDPVRAREYIRRYQTEVTDVGPRTRRRELNWAQGHLALAERRWQEGIALLGEWEREAPDPLSIVWVGWAYDQSGQADSAAALYRRYLETPSEDPAAWLDWTPRVLRRLGELYEARGDRRQAKEYYQRFTDLWAGADLEFQPLVREIRGRIARL